MSVDDLFSGNSAPGRPSPTPSLNRWLNFAIVLVVLGPCCCTSPVGAFMSLWVWSRAGDELRRVELGLHEETLDVEIGSVRNQAFSLMVISAVSLCLQVWQFHWYEAFAVFLSEEYEAFAVFLSEEVVPWVVGG